MIFDLIKRKFTHFFYVVTADSVEVYQSREEFIREWKHLRKNVDADAVTWIRHSHSTQEKIKCFRKVYKNFEVCLYSNCFNLRST